MPLLTKLILYIGVGYGAILILMYLFQNRLLYHPGKEPFSVCPSMKLLGGTSIKDPNSQTGVRYHLYTAQNPKAWLLIFHGNAGNACDRAYFIEKLKHLDLNIALVEYPGYASGDENKEPLRPSQKAILQNALETYDQIPNPNTLPVFTLGESLGSGVATYLARERPIAGLILQAPYSSTADAGSAHYPWLPVKLLLKDQFPSHQWAADVKSRVLIVHGNRDAVIPIRLGRKLAAYFPTPEQVRFVEIDGGSHNDLNIVDPEKYWGSLEAFIGEGMGRF